MMDRQYTDDMDSNLGGRLVLASVALVVLIVAVYSNTFHSTFQFDDVPYITENMRLRELANFWPPSGTRYLSYLSFAVNYHLSGLDTFGYHLTNTIIHIINSILAYLLVVLVFRTPVMRQGGEGAAGEAGGKTVFALALFCSVVFAAHPLQTESVTYITQRFASLTALFYMGSVVLYLGWRLNRAGGAADSRAWPLYVAALIAAVLAQLTKEIAFTLPAIIVLVEFLFFTVPTRSHKPATGLGRRIIPLIPFIAVFAIIPATMFLQGAPATEPGAEESIEEMVRRLQTEELSGLSRYTYLVTQFRVLVTYMRLMVLPVGQNIEYDYPMYTSILDPAVLLSFILLLAVFCGAVYLLVRSLRSRNPFGVFAAFGVFWFFITISIESSIVPILDVIFEHRLYMPLFGATAAVGGVVAYVLGNGRRRSAAARVLLIMTVVAAVGFGAATYKRNRVWADELTLYADIISKSPAKPRARYDLGVIHYKAGRYTKAVDELKLAIKLKPGYANALFMLGETYTALGDPLAAIPAYEAAVREKPNKPMMHNNLGMAYLRVERVDDGMASLRRAIELRPGFSEAHNNLGMALADIGRTDEAIAEYRLALKFKPKNAAAHFNIALAYEDAGMYEEAVVHYKEFLGVAGTEFAAYLPEAESAIERLTGRR